MAFLFDTDKQHVNGEQKMVLAVPLDISVNFTGQKFFSLKSRKSWKIHKFLMHYFVSPKDYWRQVETWHNYSYIVGQ